MSSSKSSPSSAPGAGVVASAAVFVVGTSVLSFALANWWNQKQTRKELVEWERKRQEERTGRIRAEQKLRKVLNEQSHQQSSAPAAASTSTSTTNGYAEHAMNLTCIGKVVSPYTKRMGTPRQGALVPSSRGYIQFHSSLSPEALDGIDQYSHLWVIFRFHANTSLATSKKSKIRPPRGGGIKVGQLATRSPHRPNDIGLSLVTINRWEYKTRRLYINALDLVDGTPVYDVKPFVHWDFPGDLVDPTVLKVPSWVESKSDVLAKVEFTDIAKARLAGMASRNRLAPLYPSSDDTSVEAAEQTLLEILSQDPRSSHKGEKNTRGTISSESYKLIFGKCEIEFLVKDSGATVTGINEAPPSEESSE